MEVEERNSKMSRRIRVWGSSVMSTNASEHSHLSKSDNDKDWMIEELKDKILRLERENIELR